MMITLVDGQLISQMSGQGKVPLFAESETMFFPKVVDAEIEFPKGDAKGQLVLHQNGRDMTAKRLDDAGAKKQPRPPLHPTRGSRIKPRRARPQRAG